MLDRPPSAAAIRSRNRRVRQHNGVRWVLSVRTPTKRLVAALKTAKPDIGDLDTKEAVEAELLEVIEAFVARWLGPAKK